MRSLALILLLMSGSAAALSAAALVAAGLPAPDTFGYAQFTQERRLAALDRPLRSSGTVTLSAAGFEWTQEAPFTSSLSFDGATIVERLFVDDEAIERVVHDPVTNNLTRTLFQMLSGSWQQIQSRFDVQVLDPDGTADWALQLTPLDEIVHTVMPRIVLQGGRYVDVILIEQTGGDSTSIRLTGHRSIE